MSIPEKIPIERIEEYHTHYLGRTAEGNQFWGYTTFVFTKPHFEIQGDWQDYRHEYVLLHLFDADGNLLETMHWLAGTTKQVTGVMLYNKLQEMVAQLGAIEFGDIEVKLFQTTIDGIVFGLIPDEEYNLVNLEPGATLAFAAPWDGSYST